MNLASPQAAEQCQPSLRRGALTDANLLLREDVYSPHPDHPLASSSPPVSITSADRSSARGAPFDPQVELLPEQPACLLPDYSIRVRGRFADLPSGTSAGQSKRTGLGDGDPRLRGRVRHRLDPAPAELPPGDRVRHLPAQRLEPQPVAELKEHQPQIGLHRRRGPADPRVEERHERREETPARPTRRLPGLARQVTGAAGRAGSLPTVSADRLRSET